MADAASLLAKEAASVSLVTDPPSRRQQRQQQQQQQQQHPAAAPGLLTQHGHRCASVAASSSYTAGTTGRCGGGAWSRRHLLVGPSCRSFHATSRQEILPLVAMATVIAVLVGRYSFKAVKRMDADWEDYFWQLERYERLIMQQQQQDAVENTSSVVAQNANNVAIDLGSVYTKLATFSSKPQNQQNKSSRSATSRRIPEILLSPRGDRSCFNGILYTEAYPPSATAPATRGQAALEKFYYDNKGDGGASTTSGATLQQQQQHQKVTLPWKDLEQAAHHHLDVSNVVADVLSPTLKEGLERLDNYDDVYKKGIVHGGGGGDDHHVRAVVTLPAQYLHHDGSYRMAFDKIWKDFHDNEKNENQASSAHASSSSSSSLSPVTTIFLPEAVAAIWGAQALGILPDNDDDYWNELAAAEKRNDKGTGSSRDEKKQQHSHHGRPRRPPKRFLVVDVGGFTSQFSIVDDYHIVRAAITIPWGGETILERMVACLVDAEETVSSRTIADNDARALSTLQVHARQTLPAFTLRSKSQVNIHVPYIFATPGNHHLDAVLSRSVLEQVIQDDVRQRLVPQLVNGDDSNTPRSLSPHMPVPNDLSSLFTSILTQLLESANEMPQGIHHILLVGGASQFPLVQSSLESSVSLLWGGLHVQQQQQQLAQQQKQLLVVPTTAVHASELVVLGAATMLPSFTYNVNRGLERATR
jgi:hypothetical protein